MRYLFHIPLALILIVIGAVVLTFYVLTQTKIPNKLIRFALERYIETKYNVKIEFADLGGTLLNHLIIDDIRVDTKDPGNEYRIATIERVEAFYNYKTLLKKRWELDSLLIVSPTLVLRADTAGKIVLPAKSSSETPKPQTERQIPDFQVRGFVLQDGRFQIEREVKPLLIDSIYLAFGGGSQDGVLAIDLDSVSLNYPIKGFRLRELHAGIAWSHEAIGFDTLLIETDSSLIVGGGLYSLDTLRPFHISLRNSHVSLSEIGRVFDVKIDGALDITAEMTGRPNNFTGHAVVSGTLLQRELGPLDTDYQLVDGLLSLSNLSGDLFGGTVAGEGEISFNSRPEPYSADLDVEGFDLNRLLPNTFISDINGHLILNGSGLASNTFNMDITGELGPGVFDFVRYDSISGAISLNSFDMYFYPGFTLYYKNSVFNAGGSVDYNGEMELTGEAYSSQMADFWGDLFIKELSGGGYSNYVVSGPVLDPDIRGQFRGDSCSFYGFSTDSLIADYDIESFLYGQRGWVNVFAWNSDVWNIPGDSVKMQVDVDSNLIYINQASIFDDRMFFDGTASATIVDSNIYAVVDSFFFRFDSLTYVADSTVNVDFLVDRILVHDFTVSGKEGNVVINCDYRYDGTIDLDVATNDFYFSPWLRDFQYDSVFAGQLNLDAHMSGALANPTIELSGGIRNLTLFDDTLGTVLTGMRFADSMLTVHDISVSSRGYELTGSATYPLVMNLDSGIVYVPDGPMEVKLIGGGTDLGIVSSLNENVEDLSGEYNIDLQLYGTTAEPQTRGTFELKNGRLKVYQMANPIENIEAKITSAGRQIIVEWAEGRVTHERKSLIGKSRRSGTVRAAGEINILSRDLFDYSLAVVGDEVPVQYDLGEIYGVADFDLSIRGSDPPLISGDVVVSEAEYSEEFADERITEAIEAADTIDVWDYNLNVELLPASVSVKNSTTNMVVDGTVRVLRENAKDNYIGTINIVRGNMYIADLNFRIQEGSYLVFDNVEEPDPQLFIDASLRLRNAATDITTASTTDLPLQIRGTLRNPTLGAPSGSGYSDEDIATMILMNRTVSGQPGLEFSTSSFDQRVRVGGAGYLSAIAGQKLSRTIGLETFEVTPVYGESDKIQGASFSLGLYALPNVYTYVSSLTTDDGRADYGAEYRLGRHVTIGGVYDRERLWRLNLLLNWEFR